MAFIRFVGCSVGKKICLACDTDFEKMHPDLGGGMFEVEELIEWVGEYEHVCLTGGEPLDRNLLPLIKAFADIGVTGHIETSGTKNPVWLKNVRSVVWLCVSPKPGYLPEMVKDADEVKVILQGLGDGPGWPTRQDAIEWVKEKLVYIQPRNNYKLVNQHSLAEAIDFVLRNPQLRLSVQMHKMIGVR